ncbi:MAG: VCBS repeat-containing protein [Lapillicoccus sp.]
MTTLRTRRLMALTPVLGVLATLAVAGPTAAVGQPQRPLAPHAVDIISGTGLYSVNESFDSTPVDYDGDGDMDLWVGYHDQGGALYQNDGTGHFTRVANNAWPMKGSTGHAIDRHKCVWADVDGNGLLDSYCAVGRGSGNSLKPAGANELWLQKPAGTFTDVGASWGLGDVCGRSHFPAFFNANADALPDLFVGDVVPRPVAGDPCNDPANGLPSEESKLFLNQNGTALVDTPGRGIGGNGGELCAQKLDINADGRDDLLVCASARPQLYVNQGGGQFVDEAVSRGLTGSYKALVPADLDGDGNLDLVAIAGAKLFYLRNTGGGNFAKPVVIDTFAKKTYGRAVAVGDVNGDGRPDIYGLVTNGSSGSNPDDGIYLNQGGLKFTKIPVPSAGGVGGAVEPIDVDGDGRTEFFVQNGVGLVGPTQLIRVVD